MITDILSNKNLNSIITELFIRGRKFLPKDVRLNTTHFL